MWWPMAPGVKKSNILSPAAFVLVQSLWNIWVPTSPIQVNCQTLCIWKGESHVVQMIWPDEQFILRQRPTSPGTDNSHGYVQMQIRSTGQSLSFYGRNNALILSSNCFAAFLPVRSISLRKRSVIESNLLPCFNSRARTSNFLCGLSCSSCSISTTAKNLQHQDFKLDASGCCISYPRYS